ncbi:MAG: hypothetical protein IPG50_17000 [Myxococcales bacterium]|nr:hypothetical protein [Myxococcales bacterium]
MYGFLLQDWITIRGSNSLLVSVTQSESNWASLQPYQDIVFWLEVREITVTAATNITVFYETAPLKDDSLFISMTTNPAITVASTTPTITKVLLQQNPAVPLARWVRWRLAASAAQSAAWDMTFRISCAANAVGVMG